MNPLEESLQEPEKELPKSTGAADVAQASENKAQPDNEQPKLTNIEARLLGALMEKQLATPDAYPLTVNSLIAACNQKTNREPVSNYQQGEVVRTLRELESRSLVRYEMGARSERYEQRFTNQFSLSKKQQAVLTMMLLRGPQTSSELFTRTQRMYEYTDRNDMQVSLERLTLGDEPLVVLIPKGSGQREDRYGHLLCGMPEISQASPVRATTTNDADLRTEIALLRKELNDLYELTGHSKKDTE